MRTTLKLFIKFSIRVVGISVLICSVQDKNPVQTLGDGGRMVEIGK